MKISISEKRKILNKVQKITSMFGEPESDFRKSIEDIVNYIDISSNLSCSYVVNFNVYFGNSTCDEDRICYIELLGKSIRLADYDNTGNECPHFHKLLCNDINHKPVIKGGRPVEEINIRKISEAQALLNVFKSLSA